MKTYFEDVIQFYWKVAFENASHILCTFYRLRCLRPLTHTANLETPEELRVTVLYYQFTGTKSFLKILYLFTQSRKLSAFYGIKISITFF